jgi:hypothetical protein
VLAGSPFASSRLVSAYQEYNMDYPSMAAVSLLSVIFPLLSCAAAEPGRPPVDVIRAPDGGIQPQAVIDGEGTIHVVYFKGDPAGGDIFYVATRATPIGFSRPIRVNSQPGSSIAVGTIRGAQIALGKGGRLHVAWNGSQKAVPPNPIKGSPMLYARLDESRTAFEPQRNLMQHTFGLDGGGTVAADAAGNVYVGWHSRTGDAPDGEAGRAMWFARSRDDGATFAPEAPALDRATGACACCGTRALVDSRGIVYALYRAATAGTERDMILLTSRNRGDHFEGRSLQPWRVTVCPMSSENLVEAGPDVLAAWETKGQVFFARIDPRTLVPSEPVSPPGGGNRKHPAVAANAQGETILVWAEDTGWQRGGALAWRVFDRSGRATREGGRAERGIPVWGLATVVARPDGGFTIIH